MSTNNRNRIVFPAEFGDLRPQLAPAVQGGEAIYTLYLVRQDGTIYVIPAGATFEVVYQDTSDDATYTTSAGLTATDADAGIVTWEAAAALALSGSFWLSLKVNDDVSLRVKWKIEAALDVSGAVPPVALTTLTAAQAALVVAIQGLTGLVKMAAGTASAILIKLDGTTAPGVNDDSGDGYGIGSIWIDTTNDNAYIATDVTVGAANWEQINGGGAGAVSSVFARTGAVLATSGDYGTDEITDDSVYAKPSLTSALDTIANDIGGLDTSVGIVAGDLTTHTSNTSNPHSVTATQAGALATANNLSELTATQATARDNIGAGTGSGDVTGPASSVDNQIVRFDSTTGKIIQAGTNAPTYNDSGAVAVVSSSGIPLTATGPDTSTSIFELKVGASVWLRVGGFGAISWPAAGGGEVGFAGSGTTGVRLNGGAGYKRIIFAPDGTNASLVYRTTGIVGSAQSVIANGTGDVTLVLSGTFTVSDGAGNVAGGVITATAPSGTFNLYDDGGTNTCQLQVAADGSVAVIRTAGSRTYACSLTLNWL